MTNYSVTELDISNRGLTKLPDDIIKYNKLIKLDCWNNKLTSLDNLPPTLKILYCDNNKLTSLDNLQPTLEILYCGSNQITSLDNLPLTLNKLYCENNQITSLDNLPATLLKLHCCNNPFTYKFKPTQKNIRNYCNSKLKI
jgi:Leucine-rich repeat (LRR) protein